MQKRTLLEQVELTLMEYPSTRNSDITLLIQLWETFYKEKLIWTPDGYTVRLVDLMDLPREDNIKRIRAKIQNEQRRFLPTDFSVMLKRFKNSKEWRKLLGYNDYWTEDVLERKVREIYNISKEEVQNSLF